MTLFQGKLTNTQFVSVVAIGLWTIPILSVVLFWGVLGALINIPLWLLSVLEGIELIGWVLAGGDLTRLLATPISPEAVLALTGLGSIMAGIGTAVVVFQRMDHRQPRAAAALGLIGIPHFSLLAVLLARRSDDNS